MCDLYTIKVILDNSAMVLYDFFNGISHTDSNKQ